MKKYRKFIELAGELLDRDSKLGRRYTKAESKRIRRVITEIKKLATDAKKDLIEKDNEL